MSPSGEERAFCWTAPECARGAASPPLGAPTPWISPPDSLAPQRDVHSASGWAVCAGTLVLARYEHTAGLQGLVQRFTPRVGDPGCGGIIQALGTLRYDRALCEEGAGPICRVSWADVGRKEGGIQGGWERGFSGRLGPWASLGPLTPGWPMCTRGRVPRGGWGRLLGRRERAALSLSFLTWLGSEGQAQSVWWERVMQAPGEAARRGDATWPGTHRVPAAAPWRRPNGAARRR